MRVGLLWRREWDPVESPSSVARTARLRGVFAAFAAHGVKAEPVVYADDRVEQTRDHLLALDGVLVWVNPIEQGLDRSLLDPLLSKVAAAGVFVSAHPDVIAKIATKEVLVTTQDLSWGTDTALYRSVEELRAQLPSRLLELGPLVLKQRRGMGGNGVWKIELDQSAVTANEEPPLVVQHAQGDPTPERLTIAEFVERCTAYFAGASAVMVDQPYQPRLREGMIRAYLSHDRVVGFTHQYPRGLMPPGPDDRPTGKVFEPATAPVYADLRAQLEQEWAPELQARFSLTTPELPVIWDADFLYGPKWSTNGESYVLCEINASSTFAFPEHAMPAVAEATLARIRDWVSRPSAPVIVCALVGNVDLLYSAGISAGPHLSCVIASGRVLDVFCRDQPSASPLRGLWDAF